jgi:hypothetical protein
MFDDKHERPNRRFPFRRVVLARGSARDVLTGITQGT